MTKGWTVRLALLAGGVVVALGIPAGLWRFDVDGATAASGSTTIIMVRHAERDDGYDPPLNKAGEARARALAELLGDKDIAAIYFPDFLRNRQTATPLVERLKTRPAIHTYSPREAQDTKLLAEHFVADAIGRYLGSTVLWIGNTAPVIEGKQSGNLQEIFIRLGGEGDPPIEYDDIITFVLTEGQNPSIKKAKYSSGPPSTAPSNTK